MCYMDDMDIWEIALAMEISERNVHRILRRSQKMVLKSIKKGTGQDLRRTDMEDEATAVPVITQVLESRIEDSMGREHIQKLLNKSMSAVRSSNATATRRQYAVRGKTECTEPNVSILSGWFRVIKTAAAGFVVVFKSSVLVQAATIASVGALTIGGAAVLIHEVPDTLPDTPPAAVEPAPVVEPEEQVAISTESSIDEMSEDIPQTPEPLTTAPVPVPKDEFQPDDAYVIAVEKGTIVLSSNDCECGHVNPHSAKTLYMDPARGTLEWTIAKAMEGEPTEVAGQALYSGTGEQVTTELRELYTTHGAGNYRITFTYTTGDGMRVTKSRPIFIDTGTITENQYE
jgi:predicted DNA-binding protein YlxM (UPF0122 family)